MSALQMANVFLTSVGPLSCACSRSTHLPPRAEYQMKPAPQRRTQEGATLVDLTGWAMLSRRRAGMSKALVRWEEPCSIHGSGGTRVNGHACLRC